MNYKTATPPTNSWQFHVAFWIIYWGFGAVQDLIFESHFRENYNLPLIFGAVGIVYFNYYYWLPKYLIERKQYLFYGLSIIALIWLNSYVINLIVGTFFIQDEYYFSWTAHTLISIDTMVLVAFTTAFKFIQVWNERTVYAQELERKNLETELEMLKSQINPHFIFNTLNTIYFLMEQKDGNAKNVLLKFSDILSHQLYDYNRDFIELSKEIDYLENYIDLQNLRHDEELLNLTYDFPKNTRGHKIAPMLLIPFIENAFKYSPNSKGYQISIKIEISDRGELNFKISNSISPDRNKRNKNNRKKGVGGIGIKNVKRRLELTYPNNYELKIEDDETIYSAELSINLKM